MQEWVDALERLRTRDLPCPFCSYNLRGSTTAKCPECGRDVDVVGLLSGEETPQRGMIGKVTGAVGVKYWLLGVNVAAWCAVRFLAQQPFQTPGYFLLSVAVIAALLLWSGVEMWNGETLTLGGALTALTSPVSPRNVGGRLAEIAKFLVATGAMILTALHVVVAIRAILS